MADDEWDEEAEDEEEDIYTALHRGWLREQIESSKRIKEAPPMPIRWSMNQEIFDRPATAEEHLAAKLAAVDWQLRLRAHRLLRKKVNESLDAEEQRITAGLERALKASDLTKIAVAAVVGYDLEAGATVLANPATREEIARRPMTDAERVVAEKMSPVE